MVLLSGCSMLPGGGGGDAPAERTSPNYHELAFYSHTDGAPYDGTLTVTKDGEPVHETTLDGDGNGTYLNVTRFDEPGPYTVVVDTSLPEAGGGTMHEEFTVNGTLGNATVVTMDYQTAEVTSYALGGDVDGALYLDKRHTDPVPYPIRVGFEGETIVDTTVEEEGATPFEVAALRGPGVYRVEAQGLNERWTNETIVVTDVWGKNRGSRLHTARTRGVRSRRAGGRRPVAAD
jgi:hypothetical protein